MRSIPDRGLRTLHLLLLLIVCFAIYSNNYRHAYHLDSGYTILNNPAVRSLATVPRYFVDPATYTSLRAQVDYRPLLQVSYALNYWMSGYDTWSWHFTQILLHALCAVGLYFFALRVLSMLDGPRTSLRSEHIAFVAALLFALHPTASGVVNYLNARSSLLTAVFLLPSLLAYMVQSSEPCYWKTPWLTGLLYTLALFTKVEAVGALGAYFLYDAWQTARREHHSHGFFGDLGSTLGRPLLVRLGPLLVITGVYFVIRTILMAPFEFEAARHAADVGPYQYFITQTVAWWYYVAKWFAPLGLVADNLAFPIYRSLFDGPVLLAIGAWTGVVTFLIAQWRSRPYLAFLAIAALALLSPTSSVVPLAEMVNEHRPYLPLAVLSLMWIIPVCSHVAETAAHSAGLKISFATALLVVLVTFAALTWERNLVFKSDESYWADVVDKAPSSRAYVNYGLTFMGRGDFASARDYFNRSLEAAPYWYITHTNLGIVYDRLGQEELARRHFDEAVRYDEYTGSALSYRGEFHLSHRRYAEAMNDFRNSIPKSLELYRNYRGMATSSAGLGDAQQSYENTRQCLQLDPGRTAADITSIAAPFFDDPGLLQRGLDYFEKLKADLPDTWWVYGNIAILARRLGQDELAAEADARSSSLRRVDD